MQTAELLGNAALCIKNSITYLWYQDTANSEPHYISKYWLHQTGQLHCYHHILKQSLEQSESYSRELLTLLLLKHLIPEPSANVKNEAQKACCIKTLYQRSSYGLHVPNILHFLNFSAFTVGHVICTHIKLPLAQKYQRKNFYISLTNKEDSLLQLT